MFLILEYIFQNSDLVKNLGEKYDFIPCLDPESLEIHGKNNYGFNSLSLLKRKKKWKEVHGRYH